MPMTIDETVLKKIVRDDRIMKDAIENYRSRYVSLRQMMDNFVRTYPRPLDFRALVESAKSSHLQNLPPQTDEAVLDWFYGTERKVSPVEPANTGSRQNTFSDIEPLVDDAGCLAYVLADLDANLIDPAGKQEFGWLVSGQKIAALGFVIEKLTTKVAEIQAAVERGLSMEAAAKRPDSKDNANG